MKKHAFLVSLLALTVALALPSQALAGAETIHTQGNSADAHFWGTDPTGCLFTSVSLYVSETRVQDQGAPGSSHYLYVSISQWDGCTTFDYTFAAYGSTSLPTGTFQGSPNDATLRVTVPVYSWPEGSVSEITADLTWTGTGEVFQGSNSYHYIYPWGVFSGRSSGSARLADVSGSLRAGTTDYLQGLTASYANLHQVRSGSVSLIRPSQSTGQ